MQLKKILIVYILIILITPVLGISVSSQNNDNLPDWNENWKYRQEITLPITTNNPYAIFQPIDIQIEFNNDCWARKENEHSVRVLCWDGDKWHELDSQIYQLEFESHNIIKKCGLVFLIPELANGEERYFVYYDNYEKNPPNYYDHVNVEDAYYYFEPIPGLLVEADYYKITEDEYVVYGVGQKGTVIYRKLSHAIVKQKPETKEFSLTDSDNLASFGFAYHKGYLDEDEVSSEDSLISKDITIDGNLMVEFKILSESKDKNIRTSNTYKYYYCPTVNKRINIHVRHNVLKDTNVSGILNVDGRIAAVFSYHSKSERIEKMRFGKILPYLHIYGEDNRIKEYLLNLDPEEKEREWIVPYTDDIDLGKEAWFSYDEGETGKAHGIIFSSNENIIRAGKDERDGISLKASEREYLDALGAEIDYAAMHLTRNSYEKGSIQDKKIPGDLFIEYNAEFYTSEEGGYLDVIEEGKIYRELIKHRFSIDDDSKGSENIHVLTVIPRITGRILANPIFQKIGDINITAIYADLYKDGEHIATNFVNEKPLFGAPRIKFPKLSTGSYIVKIYRKIGDQIKSFIGFESVEIIHDTVLDVICTWPKDITIKFIDQEEKFIEGIEVTLARNETLVYKDITSNSSNIVFTVPFSFIRPYNLTALYKGFKIYDEILPMFGKEIDVKFNLYDFEINIRDKLEFPPDVNVKPYLTSSKMTNEVQIFPVDLGFGRYLFKDLPEASYNLYISYGGFSEIFTIDVPIENGLVDIKFNAEFDFKTLLYDSRGNRIDSKGKYINVFRENKKIINSMEAGDIGSVPPGNYQLRVYSDEGLIAIKNVNINNDKNIKIVSTISSIIPTLINTIIIIFIGQIVVLLIFKKISLNSFLKLCAMCLILLSLFHPWWMLDASSGSPASEKTTDMYIVPGTMIEKVEYKNIIYLDIANLPEIFTNFLGGLLLIVGSGFILIGISFIPNILFKKRYSSLLISASVLFLILVTIAYFFGMSQITEISLGSLQGEGILEVTLPDQTTSYMSSVWGLGQGFYLCLFAAIFALIAGIIDYIRKKQWSIKLVKE
jgi:hypothetical protein